MGRTVVLEENLIPHISQFASPNAYAVGLILGQSAGQRDYVVHFARTPRPAKEDIEEETIETNPFGDKEKESTEKPITSIKDLEENWVADHAKHVTRMLPGGMWVLGIFTVGKSDPFEDSGDRTRVRCALVQIREHFMKHSYLHGDGPSTEKLALHYNPVTQKFVCRSVDLNSSVFRPADLKILSSPTKWHHLECHMGFDQWFPLPQSSSVKPLKRLIMDIVGNISRDIEGARCLIEGEPRESSDPVESIGGVDSKDEEIVVASRKKNKGSSSPQPSPTKKNVLPLEVNLFMPCNATEDNFDSSGVTTIDCCGEVRLVGVLACRVFLHQKATVEEAEKAVKTDIMRSLYSRLEMHWDSLIEEEQGCPEDRLTLHEPPRKVLVSLPAWDGRVELLEYIFPGEGPSEALISLRELLSLNVDSSSVQECVEPAADASEFSVMHRSMEEVDPSRGKGCGSSDSSHHTLVDTVRNVLSSCDDQGGSSSGDARRLGSMTSVEMRNLMLLISAVVVVVLGISIVLFSNADSGKRQ
ncbi:protein odr-4 homolog [Ischnura elegans]|uniref:protein odr-4 homolog n=1 Tax=Ischnura elegans TaxID=197161 RepID=UPI001ED8B363|nr:protein odr-4 homolog [Ischnura elegans]